jgi:PAS domain S-box-containing protein
VTLDFETIAETIPHIVWVARPDGFTEYWNRLGRERMGVDLDQACAWQWLEMLHPDDMARVRFAWAQATRTNEPYAMEYRIRHADGSYRWIAARGTPVHEGDEIVKWVGTWTDIHACKGTVTTPPPATRLTNRELEVLRLAAEGVSGPGIAEKLRVRPATIKSHFDNVYKKLGVGDRTAAVVAVLRLGLIS